MTVFDDIRAKRHPRPPDVRSFDYDAQQDFWLGVSRAASEGADAPTAMRAGYNEVNRMRRKEITHLWVVDCLRCDKRSAPLWKEQQYVCRSCYSDDVVLNTRLVAGAYEIPVKMKRGRDPIKHSNTRLMRDTLVGRERDVFDAITGRTIAPCERCPNSCIGGIPRGDCDSFMMRIAKWLNINPSSVNTYRKRAIERCLDFVLRKRS